MESRVLHFEDVRAKTSTHCRSWSPKIPASEHRHGFVVVGEVIDLEEELFGSRKKRA
jgi:hypothetical protein